MKIGGKLGAVAFWKSSEENSFGKDKVINCVKCNSMRLNMRTANGFGKMEVVISIRDLNKSSFFRGGGVTTNA